MTHETDAKRPTGANVIATMTAEERAKLEARFWCKTRLNEATGCLEWIGAIGGNGYGSFGVAPGIVSDAHRVAFVLAHGAVPANLAVRHKCHNTHCVQAEHLRTGTHADNMRDMKDAGRGCVGPGSRRRRLSAKDATGLFGSRFLKMPLKDVSKAWGVSASTAKAVRGGRAYAETIDHHTDEVLVAEAEAAQRASGKAPDRT